MSQCHIKLLRTLLPLQVDDIICHLDGSIAPALCQERFESCADIVIPHSMQIPLADPVSEEAASEEGETATSVPPSDLSPFLFLLGLADMAEDEGPVSIVAKVLSL